MKPLGLTLLAPVLVTLAACSPAVTATNSPSTKFDPATAELVGKFLQPGQRWMTHGIMPDGQADAYAVTVKSPIFDRMSDGRVLYTQQGLTSLSYTQANATEVDRLTAGQIQHGTDGRVIGFRQCVVKNPGSARDLTRLTGVYTATSLSGIDILKELPKEQLGTCTLTLQP